MTEEEGLLREWINVFGRSDLPIEGHWAALEKVYEKTANFFLRKKKARVDMHYATPHRCPEDCPPSPSQVAGDPPA